MSTLLDAQIQPISFCIARPLQLALATVCKTERHTGNCPTSARVAMTWVLHVVVTLMLYVAVTLFWVPVGK